MLVPSNSCTILAATSPTLRSSRSGLAAPPLTFGTSVLHCSGLCKCTAYLSATKKLHIHSELMIPMDSASSPCSPQGQHPPQALQAHRWEFLCCMITSRFAVCELYFMRKVSGEIPSQNAFFVLRVTMHSLQVSAFV